MFTLAFERLPKVLMARFSSVFSSDDIEAIDAAVLGFVAHEGPVRGILDFSDVEAVAVSGPRLAVRSRRPPIVPGQDRVFVTPRPDIYGLGRTFAEQQRIAGGGEPKVATTLAEAYAALGLADPQFDPVETR